MLRALLLTASLVTGCGASTDPEPAPAPPERWSVELGTAPTLLAVVEDAVLAASYGTGVGGSQVYRVDRGTGRLVAQRTVAGQPNGMAVAPDGALWLATLRLPDQSSGTGLQVLDPVSLATRRTVPVPGVPLSVAFVGEALWTGDARGVQQLDPATGEVLRTVPTAHPANRLVLAGGGLVVVGPQGVQRVDPDTGSTSEPVALPAAGSATATGDAEHLWVVHPDDRARAVLQPYDPVSLLARPAAPSPGQAGAAAHLADDALWVSDPSGGRLLCADPATGTPRGEREVRLTGPVAADARTVVVAQPGGMTGLPAECGAAS